MLWTLPQHQSSSSSATNGRKKVRLSGNPRPYSTGVATLDDFSAPSEDSGPAMVLITVGILPKVFDSSDYNDPLDPSPRYSWKNGEVEFVERRLQTANLVFSVEVNPTGPILELIDTAFVEHCSKQNINFLSPTPASANAQLFMTPNNLGWMLAGPRGRSGNRTWVEDPKCLTQFTFTVSALRASPYNNTPNYLGEGIFIFIVPRLRNLFGPIDCLFDPPTRRPDHVLTHKCFARRVLHPILASLSDEASPTCGSSCIRTDAGLVSALASTSAMQEHIDLTCPLPSIDSDDSDDDVHSRKFPEVEVLIDQLIAEGLPPLEPAPRSGQILTRAAHRRQWQEENARPSTIPSVASFVACPLLLSLMDSASVSVKNHMAEIHGPSTDEVLILTAASVDAGARALITYCIWLQSVRQPPGVKLKEVLQEQFPTPRPTLVGPYTDVALFGLRVHIGPGFGKGPRAEVLARAVAIVMADALYWTDCDKYKTLHLHPSLSPVLRRSSFLKAVGLIFLLHFLHVGAPIPASPFMFSALFNGRQTACRFDLDFLTRFISRDSLAYIKKFHSTAADKPLYTSQDEDCAEYQYLLNIPGFDPSLISPTRSEEEHKGICTSIISFITFGAMDIQCRPEFLAITDGFNVAIEPFGEYDQVHHVLEWLNGPQWFETPCRELIISMYDVGIKAVSDVLSRIIFSETNGESDPWNENAETIGLIRQFLTHYLTGQGHPYIPGRVLEALGIDDRDPHDPLVRVRLFMAVMMGSPVWALKVNVIHDWNEDFPRGQDFGPEAKASFQSCFKTVSITNNASLRHMLLSETPLEGFDTKFGQWFHGQALSSRESYTAA
ncbi:hypothetical protein DFH07DRAFT_781773 [Mycena maculata]|uniref:Uncharacterized protein n=1 Tax=Mycena maculata TaxID=230809 RepID=A0AAD7HXP2_9AGAR|nr:hypothetical protein DFH07DRAFT_781773 [Mycena maculata]